MNLLADAAKSRGDREAFVDFCMVLASLARVCDEMIERDPLLRPVWEEVRRSVRRNGSYNQIASGEITSMLGREQGVRDDEAE